MSRIDALHLLERRMADAMTAPDPVAAVEATACDPALPDDLRACARAALANPDGIRMSALIVARLRFERLVQGSMRAAQWFERDPAGFTAEFRRYHTAVPPRSPFPWDEARAFEAWAAAE